MARNPVVGRALVALVDLRRRKVALRGPAKLGGRSRPGSLQRGACRQRATRVSTLESERAARRCATACTAVQEARRHSAALQVRAQDAPASPPPAARRSPTRRAQRRCASARAAQRPCVAPGARQKRTRRVRRQPARPPAPTGGGGARPRSAWCCTRALEARAVLGASRCDDDAALPLSKGPKKRGEGQAPRAARHVQRDGAGRRQQPKAARKECVVTRIAAQATRGVARGVVAQRV